MSLKRNISVIWLLCLVQFSCEKLDNQKTCFLDFRLAMPEYEYEKLVKRYLQEGVLMERKYQEPYVASGTKAFVYTFPKLKLESIIEPIFRPDRMVQFVIFVGGSISPLKYHQTQVKDYEKLVQHFESVYGKPFRHYLNSETGHRQAYWEQLPDFDLKIIYSPSSLDWKGENKPTDWEGNIGIYFTPKEDLKNDLERYDQEKKQLREQYDKEQQPTSATPAIGSNNALPQLESTTAGSDGPLALIKRLYHRDSLL